MARQGDFSQGSVKQTVLRIGLPIMLAEFIHILYNMVDRMFIGHMPDVGTDALTGIGLVVPLITLIGAFSALCGSGGSPLMNIARGEGNGEKAQSILETAFGMLLAVGAVLTVVLYAFAEPILRLLGGDEATLPYALDYFRVYVLGCIPVLIALGMNSYITSQGFSTMGMLTVAIGAVLNLALDPLFISTLGMGVKGAAMATVISQTVSALWVILFLTGKKPELRIRRLCIHRKEILPIMSLGVTGFAFKMTNSLTQALVNVTLRMWGGAAGSLYIAAMSSIYSIREFASLPGGGLVDGGKPVLSFNYGAKLFSRVSETIRFILVAALSIKTVMWAFIQLCPELLLRVFTDDAELIAVAVPCVHVFFAVFPLMALQQTGQNVFVALNMPRYALFFSILRKVLLIAPLTLLLPAIGLGVMGVFWAEMISQLVGASMCFAVMNHKVWKPMRRKLLQEARSGC